MKIKFIFTTMLLLTFSVIYASNSPNNNSYEDYYNYIIDAEEAMASLDINSALNYYEKAFETEYPFPDDIIAALKCCEKLEKDQLAHELIQLLIQSGYKTEEPIMPFSLDSGYITRNEFPIAKYQTYFDFIYTDQREKYLSTISKENSYILSSFETLEHFIAPMRRKLQNDDDIKGWQEISYETIYELLLKLEKDKSIDISRKNTDAWIDMKFIVSIIHTTQWIYEDETKRKKLNAFLKKMVFAGNLHPKQYAMIIDGAHIRIDNKTFYGEMYGFKVEGMVFEPIEHIQNIDSIRAEVFLAPLWVKAKLMNLKLPKDYTKKENE